MAVAAAAPDTPVLVVSTDPAPSIADALLQQVGDAEVAVSGAPGLFARQMDATAAFERFRRDYRRTIDEVFDALVVPGVDVSHDRAIMQELLAFAPPGIDEVYALAALGETVADGRFASIVVDPAPTGHLLRLLDLPARAVEWSHQLMRLMLKYREVVRVERAAEELLGFTRRTKRIAALLIDPASTGAVVAALDEPLVRDETERLVGAVRERAIDVTAVVWNRVDAATPPPRALPSTPPLAQFVASAVSPAPRGVEALRRWHAGWRRLPIADD
jgi:arsenite-transporting ATPase